MSERNQEPSLNAKVEVLSGFAFPSSGFNQLDGMPLIRIRDLGGRTTEVRFRGTYDPAYLVTKGDLLVGMDGDFEVFMVLWCAAVGSSVRSTEAVVLATG